jgi:glycosyltransferase involved in cell wall biosynthesis
MRVLFLTGRELSYARNEVLLRAFQRFSTVEVAAPTHPPKSLLTASLRVVGQALSLLRRNRYDLVFTGFYGYLILQLLGRLVRPPVLFDAFVSNYDTLCFDRQTFAPASLPGRLAFWLDWSTCLLATQVLLDTQAHVDYFTHTFALPAARFTAVPVGCSDDLYRPQPYAPQAAVTQVLSYNTFLPLHGVETILRAVAQLTDQRIAVRMIGAGPLLAHMQQLAADLKLACVTFIPPVPPPQLAAEIGAADICLGGHFGPSAKAGRVIPGKIYQMLAVGRAVIAGDAPGNRELLHHRHSAYLVPAGDAAALAAALLTLHTDRNLRAQLAQHGRQVYEQRASEAVITQQVQHIVERMLATG